MNNTPRTGKALPGEHYCEKHQGNHAHYAEKNCTVCKLERELADRTAPQDDGYAKAHGQAGLMEPTAAPQVDITDYMWLVERLFEDGTTRSCPIYFSGFLIKDGKDFRSVSFQEDANKAVRFPVYGFANLAAEMCRELDRSNWQPTQHGFSRPQNCILRTETNDL